jgi:hypothetical protein
MTDVSIATPSGGGSTTFIRTDLSFVSPETEDRPETEFTLRVSKKQLPV